MNKNIELDSNNKIKSNQDYLERLNKIYQKLPEFDCGDCRDCENFCIRPVTFLIEFENILRFIDINLSSDQKTRMIKDIVIMYHARILYKQTKNEVVGSKCVFRDNLLNKCIIYTVRPMACRIFGLKGLRRDDPICQACKRDCERVRIVNHQDFDCSMITLLYQQIAELSHLFKKTGIDEFCFLPLNAYLLEIWLSLKYVGIEETRKAFGEFDYERLLEIALRDPCLKNRKILESPRYYGEWKNATI